MSGLVELLEYSGMALLALLLLYIALRIGTLAVLKSIADFRDRPPRLAKKARP